MVKPLIAANWKMHKTVGEAIDFARRIVAEFSSVTERDIVIAPPFTAIRAIADVLKDSPIHLSAQNMHWAEQGAFTGEISAPMLVDAGCDYVIIGHSERRSLFGERDEDINRKIATARKFDLKTIFCIGETLEERNSQKTFDVIKRQFTEGLNNISSNDIRHIVIAYEPVWAIGTGKTATADQAEEAHRFIRTLISERHGTEVGDIMRILYGGSVNPDNVAGLMAQPNINGALVGGASLDYRSFADIISF
jgi:triosephosphate isomerase